MANQIFTDGDVHQIDGQDFECIGVSYRETDGEKHDFVYHFQLKSEIDAQREVAAKAEADAKEQARLAEEARSAAELPPPAEPAPSNPQPEEVSEPVNKQEEETQYVK